MNIMKALPIGVMDYHRLVSNDYYFVDKSLIIKDFLERKSVVTFITRPRRFGKTLNMSMMAEFFDITKESNDIFKETAIMNTDYASEINQYPTIFISFADAKGDKRKLVRTIKKIIFNLYKTNKEIISQLDQYDQLLFHNIEKNLINFDDGNLDGVEDALSFLMEQMEKYYGKKVMVFIDEYDTPFIEAHIGGFYDEIRSTLSFLLHNALKTSTSLQYAMLTGIQRVAKENIFSDLNNLIVCTVRDFEYSQYFGFTEEEAEDLLEYYDLSLNEDVRNMYDGYQFGENEIYNPWSLINYASRKVLSPYWVNTSANVMIKKAMENRDISFDKGYEKLIETGYLETLVRLETSFFEVSSTASLWGLFVNAGYLTIDHVVSFRRNRYVVRIPNQEVQEEFQTLTSYYLDVSDTDLSDLFNSLLNESRLDFENYYTKIILTLPSYHDLKDENSYHMMFLGMCAWLSHDYEIINNKEEGKGRCDIILKAKRNDMSSYIIEFKYLKKAADKEKLSAMAKEAVEQIITKKYDANLTGKVIYIGLAHYHKDVAIEWQRR